MQLNASYDLKVNMIFIVKPGNLIKTFYSQFSLMLSYILWKFRKTREKKMIQKIRFLSVLLKSSRG